ncbi:PREDICTED: maestro heat-like repeat family member 5, partial [Sturnus vulgaris]|uniref:maestro heat-like repeat family member 5 n=1 Tax=Sturnus vulgaris TaxID=9172 RepID=UPI00071A10C8
MEMFPLVLRALVTLSERAETAGKMKSLLQDLLRFLWHWSWENTMMAMEIFHNVLGHLKKREASSTAVMMVHNLLHLFDAKEECVRERSICLFRDVLGKTVWRDKKVMKRNAWKALVRLLLHMSDKAPSVAKASKEAILAIAELLKWQELKHL